MGIAYMMADAGDPISPLMSPIVQYGFAGLCVGLLGIIVWIIKEYIKQSQETQNRLVSVIEKNNDVIDGNTSAIKELTIRMVDQSVAITRLHDDLVKRPCIAVKDT